MIIYQIKKKLTLAIMAMNINFAVLPDLSPNDSVLNAPFYDFELITYLINQGFNLDKNCFIRIWLMKFNNPGVVEYEDRYFMKITANKIFLSKANSAPGLCSLDKSMTIPIMHDDFTTAYLQATKELKDWGGLIDT